MTPTLYTNRLILRPHIIEDADILYKQYQDFRMIQYTKYNPYSTLEMAKETIHHHMKEDYSWAITKDNHFIGTIGAYDENDTSIEVGISIFPDYWNQGYGYEALITVLDYLLERKNTVIAWCHKDNIASKTVLEKCDMILVRENKEKYYFEKEKNNEI